MFTLQIKDYFAAAHKLVGYDGPCSNLHGHTWHVHAKWQFESLSDQGMATDFKQLKLSLHSVLDTLDHTYLNDLIENQPTAERIAQVIYTMLKKDHYGISLKSVTVFESPEASATYCCN